jgi:uncharacterized protein YchJ
VTYRANIYSMLSRGDNIVIEHCTFKQENNKWLYLEGIHETATQEGTSEE